MQRIIPAPQLLATIRYRLQTSPRHRDRPLHLSVACGVPRVSYNLLWRPLPVVLLLTMAGAVFLLDAVLPLRNLGFTNALHSLRGAWIFWPAHLLFPQQALVTSGGIPHQPAATPAFLRLSWHESFYFLGACMVVFLPYLAALCVLPQRVTQRYLLASTLLLGLLYLLIPVVTSQDMFLYIGYARMSALYHLNPFTTPPLAIKADPIYPHIYWVHQPSLYGPTWVGALAALQWLALKCGLTTIAPMILLMRLFGLSVHIASTQLIWSLSGELQRLQGSISLLRRKQVTLAFAWNPLLLFEACVNVHADALMLFLLLLAIWVIVRAQGGATVLGPGGWMCAAVILALATAVKVNIAILLPGLLLYMWNLPQRLRSILPTVACYLGTLLILYVPFWSRGAVLKAVYANPSSYRNLNTLAEFFTIVYKSNVHFWRYHPAVVFASSIEKVTHNVSLLLFVGTYAWLLWRGRARLRTPRELLCWMAIVWLFYCIFGSPWFWPWYAVTFLGLFALLASLSGVSKRAQALRFAPGSTFPLSISLFAFSMLSIYFFFTWAPQSTAIHGLPGTYWAYLRSLWPWCISLLALLCVPLERLRRPRNTPPAATR